MTGLFDGIIPPLDVAGILTLAKTYEGPDRRRVVRAFEERYPVQADRCRLQPGYTDTMFEGYIMDIVLDYARYNAPPLFRAMMIERYTAGGMDAETAHHFISQELTAVQRGNFYTNGGRKWV